MSDNDNNAGLNGYYSFTATAYDEEDNPIENFDYSTITTLDLSCELPHIEGIEHNLSYDRDSGRYILSNIECKYENDDDIFPDPQCSFNIYGLECAGQDYTMLRPSEPYSLEINMPFTALYITVFTPNEPNE